MKKILISILLIVCLLLDFTTFSYQLTNGEDDAINSAVEIFQKRIIKNNEKVRDAVVAELNKIGATYDIDSRNYEIIKVLTEKIDVLDLTPQNIEDNSNTEGQIVLCDENYAPVCAKTTNSGAITFSNKCFAENATNFKAILFEGACEEEDDLSNILIEEKYPDEVNKANISKVKETWLERQNEVRHDLGLTEYTYSDKLDTTAQEWSEILLSRGDLDVESVHKRDLNDSYYDYNKIASWLKDRGVVCKYNNATPFSESVAWTSYYCDENKTDCTDEFIHGLRVSFDRYMAERDKNENSRPHYNAIVSKTFSTIGMGTAVRKKSENYFEVFITTHYCSELE